MTDTKKQVETLVTEWRKGDRFRGTGFACEHYQGWALGAIDDGVDPTVALEAYDVATRNMPRWHSFYRPAIVARLRTGAPHERPRNRGPEHARRAHAALRHKGSPPRRHGSSDEPVRLPARRVAGRAGGLLPARHQRRSRAAGHARGSPRRDPRGVGGGGPIYFSVAPPQLMVRPVPLRVRTPWGPAPLVLTRPLRAGFFLP